MNRQDAIDFIDAINAAQPYVPPILFGPIINSVVGRLAVAVANNAVICDVKEPVRPSHAAPKGNGAADQPEHAADGSVRPQ